MGAAAKRSKQEPEVAALTPGAALRAELYDTAKKAAKAGQVDDAIYHFIAVFILDISLSWNAEATVGDGKTAASAPQKYQYDPETIVQIRKLAKKRYGDQLPKLWVAFADVQQEMLSLLAPLTKALDLGTSLQCLKESLNK